MSTCQCGEKATRLLKVVWKDPAKRTEHQVGPMSFDRSTRFAACEPHRHSAKRILEHAWRSEVDREEVVVLMGPRRRAGS